LNPWTALRKRSRTGTEQVKRRFTSPSNNLRTKSVMASSEMAIWPPKLGTLFSAAFELFSRL